MCKGGAIFYQIHERSGVTEDWILEHVVPNMVRRGVPRPVCKVLGRAVLFRACDASGDDAFPPQRRTQILRALSDLGDRNQLAAGDNPIQVSNIFS